MARSLGSNHHVKYGSVNGAQLGRDLKTSGYFFGRVGEYRVRFLLLDYTPESRAPVPDAGVDGEVHRLSDRRAQASGQLINQGLVAQMGMDGRLFGEIRVGSERYRARTRGSIYTAEMADKEVQLPDHHPLYLLALETATRRLLEDYMRIAIIAMRFGKGRRSMGEEVQGQELVRAWFGRQGGETTAGTG